MGRDLYDGSDAARAVFETADRVLDQPTSALCFEGPADRLQDTEFAQPALFTTCVACLEAAREAGGLNVAPAFVAGHSLGEYTALVAGGALSFEDGLLLVQARGRLMKEEAENNPGAMAAILGLDETAVSSLCDEAGAEVCNLNAPGQVVIGGTEAAVEAAMALAIERGARRGVRLRVSGAFHTSFMLPAVDAMARAVAATPMRDPAIPVVANTTGQPLTKAAELRTELVEQLARPVQWVRSVQYLASQGVDAVIEFGPGRVLTGLVRRIDRSIGVRNISSLQDAQARGTPSSAPP